MNKIKHCILYTLPQNIRDEIQREVCGTTQMLHQSHQVTYKDASFSPPFQKKELEEQSHNQPEHAITTTNVHSTQRSWCYCSRCRHISHLSTSQSHEQDAGVSFLSLQIGKLENRRNRDLPKATHTKW